MERCDDRIRVRSLGAEEYRRQLSAVSLSVTGEYEDEGQNHYYDVRKDERRLRVEKTETQAWALLSSPSS